MIRLNKLILILCFGLLPLFGHAQNLFDKSGILKFADFLYATHQYKFASEEYERLVLLDPDTFRYKLNLIRSYRLGENYERAGLRINDIAADSLNTLSGPLAIEYLKVELLRGNFKTTGQYLVLNNRLPINTKQIYQEYLFLLQNNWQATDSFYHRNHMQDTRYDLLLSDAGKIHIKSPLLAGTFSAILPGLGKGYAGYWKDGGIALLFVSANAWQAYRGFSKFGVSNATGWIFGTFAVGFYLGNIYGSVKAALKHNRMANDKLNTRAKNLIYSDIQ
jgi:hypothetical protein